MKIILLFIFILYLPSLFGQKLSEKEIASLDIPGVLPEAWNMRYDIHKGTWLYAHYDTSRKYFLYDKTGVSGPFTYIITYSCVFDESGNYYLLVDNSDYESGRNEYLMFKNGKKIMRFDYINDQWVYRNGVIYFYYKDKEKYYFAKYNTLEERLETGKPYDEISYIYYPQRLYEGEPLAQLAFTSDGREIYGASDKGKKFIVKGSEEGKKYSDIDFYNTLFDYRGEVCFIAKSSGTLWTAEGGCFIVYGGKEYKKFDYIYGPLILSPDNVPVYVGQDSIGEYKYRSYLMKGNEEIDKITGSISDFKFSPDGKLAYVKSREVKKGKDIYYESQLISGNWKSKLYSSIYHVKFSPEGEIFYAASGNDNKSSYYKGDKKITESFDNVYGMTWLRDGRFLYIATRYGNYDQKIPDENYYFIGNEKYGPFEMSLIVDYVSGSYFSEDGFGNFVFSTGRNINKDSVIYKYRVHSNKFTSEEFDGITDTRVINGKIIFIANYLISSDPYLYNYRIYVDNNPLGEGYSSVGEIQINDKGNMQFIAFRGGKFYLVELEV